jgi:hypothetical protein
VVVRSAQAWAPLSMRLPSPMLTRFGRWRHTACNADGRRSFLDAPALSKAIRGISKIKSGYLSYIHNRTPGTRPHESDRMASRTIGGPGFIL